jgi:hypothetical protein
MAVSAPSDFARTGGLAFSERQYTMATRLSPGYRAINLVVRDQDAAEMKRISQSLKGEGWTHATSSFVHRAACVILTDSLRGKSAEEILRFFVEYRARREQRRPGVSIPGPPKDRS